MAGYDFAHAGGSTRIISASRSVIAIRALQTWQMKFASQVSSVMIRSSQKRATVVQPHFLDCFQVNRLYVIIL
jgi:hypothetical protein